MCQEAALIAMREDINAPYVSSASLCPCILFLTRVGTTSCVRHSRDSPQATDHTRDASKIRALEGRAHGCVTLTDHCIPRALRRWQRTCPLGDEPESTDGSEGVHFSAPCSLFGSEKRPYVASEDISVAVMRPFLNIMGSRGTADAGSLSFLPEQSGEAHVCFVARRAFVSDRLPNTFPQSLSTSDSTSENVLGPVLSRERGIKCNSVLFASMLMVPPDSIT